MVILGGLELVAAGYLLHRHSENKRERARLRDDAAALEESSYPIYSNQRPHSHHGRTSSRDRETSEERHERRRRRRKEKEREEQRKYEYERPGREQSAPPKMQAQRPLYHPPPQQQQQQMNPQMQPQRPYYPPGQGQFPAQQQGYPPTGIPPNWNQAAPPPAAPQMQRAATPNAAAAAAAAPSIGPNGYPQDVKYGFDPAIPHSEVPPPPYTPTAAGPSSSTPYLPVQNTGDSSRASGGSIGRERANTLEVRGRHRVRRSVSPNLGVYEEGAEGSAPPRVRFSTEDVVLGEERRSRGRRQDRAPPAY